MNKPSTYALGREYDSEARRELLGSILLTDESLTRLLERQGFPPGAEAFAIKRTVVELLKGLDQILEGQTSDEIWERMVLYHCILSHDTVVYSRRYWWLQTISLYTLDWILVGPHRFEAIRLVRRDNPKLTRESIRNLQRFLIQTFQLLDYEAKGGI